MRVVSCGVLALCRPGRLLLCHATGGRYWDIPKGVGEAGETPRDTAVRETQEETGLRLDAPDLVDLGSFAYRPSKDLHLFAAWLEPVDPAELACTSVFRDAKGQLRPEVDAFRWVPFADVTHLCAASMARVFAGPVDLALIHARLIRRAGE